VTHNDILYILHVLFIPVFLLTVERYRLIVRYRILKECILTKYVVLFMKEDLAISSTRLKITLNKFQLLYGMRFMSFYLGCQARVQEEF
jgi:hypothetical protein